MRTTLLAIDAVFAVRIPNDVELPVVPLIILYDLTNRKYGGDAVRSNRAQLSEFQMPEENLDAAIEALHYMQALDWIAQNVKPGFTITMETVLFIHEMLLNGTPSDERYHSFRSTPLPKNKGADPASIPVEISELCKFSNGDYFSPLGQASVIHHAFESMSPFDSLVDRTGLLFAFMPMFRRGPFVDGYMVPICWGASLEKNYRQKLRNSSRDKSSPKTHLHYRERWAAYNARNTHVAAVIADSFLSRTDSLRKQWRSRGMKLPANSAIDKLLDLFLAVPCLTIKHAAQIIGKSYGATNEAMSQLVKEGIVRETALDRRERIFICNQSTSMITGFVDELIEMSQKAKDN